MTTADYNRLRVLEQHRLQARATGDEIAELVALRTLAQLEHEAERREVVTRALHRTIPHLPVPVRHP
jgi:hypothetical protein